MRSIFGWVVVLVIFVNANFSLYLFPSSDRISSLIRPIFVRRNLCHSIFQILALDRDNQHHLNHGHHTCVQVNFAPLQIKTHFHRDVQSVGPMFKNRVAMFEQFLLDLFSSPEFNKESNVAVFAFGPDDLSIFHKSTQALFDLGLPAIGWDALKEDAKYLTMAPDWDFIKSKGYEHKFDDYKPIPFEAKKRKAVWRGCDTGQNNDAQNCKDLLRGKMCIMAKNYTDIIDAKFYTLCQSDAEAKTYFEEAGIVGSGLSTKEMLEYLIQIDIDGNTNAWSSCFWKLKSYSLTLKVESTRFVQWYYNKLIPWKHFVPVHANLSNLIESIEWSLNKDNEVLVRNMIQESTNLMTNELSYQSVILEFRKIMSRYVFEYDSHPLLALDFSTLNKYFT